MILEHQNNKQKLQILEALGAFGLPSIMVANFTLLTYILVTYNPNLTELILKVVLMYVNVFSY